MKLNVLLVWALMSMTGIGHADPSIRSTAMTVGFSQDSAPRAEKTGTTGMPVGLHETVLNGVYKKFYPDGKIQSMSQYKNGKPEGYTREYYPNGRLSFIQTVHDGKINGPVKAYYENGALKAEIRYVDNLEDGILKEYYEDGKVKEEATYIKGEMLNLRKFDEQGKLIFNQERNFPPSCGIVADKVQTKTK